MLRYHSVNTSQHRDKVRCLACIRKTLWMQSKWINLCSLLPHLGEKIKKNKKIFLFHMAIERLLRVIIFYQNTHNYMYVISSRKKGVAIGVTERNLTFKWSLRKAEITELRLWTNAHTPLNCIGSIYEVERSKFTVLERTKRKCSYL